MSIPRIKGISKVIKLSPSPTLLDTKIYFLEKIEKLPVSFKEGSICWEGILNSPSEWNILILLKQKQILKIYI